MMTAIGPREGTSMDKDKAVPADQEPRTASQETEARYRSRRTASGPRRLPENPVSNRKRTRRKPMIRLTTAKRNTPEDQQTGPDPLTVPAPDFHEQRPKE